MIMDIIDEEIVDTFFVDGYTTTEIKAIGYHTITIDN